MRASGFIFQEVEKKKKFEAARSGSAPSWPSNFAARRAPGDAKDAGVNLKRIGRSFGALVLSQNNQGRSPLDCL